jgi:fructokinase
LEAAMLVVGGESLIDLVWDGQVERGELVLRGHAGGSPYNCALALGRLGEQAGFLCPISRDGFGVALTSALVEAGVRVLLDRRVAEPTTLAVVSFAGGQPRYDFHRGADRAFTAEDLIAALPKAMTLLQLGGFCAVEPDDAEAWLAVAQEARRRGAVVSIDPNVRPALVTDFAAYRGRLGRLLDQADIIKVSDEDLQALEPGPTIEGHARALLARPHCELVMVTMGAAGVAAFTPGVEVRVSAYSPPVFGDTVGAGDCLMAGVLTGLAEGDWLGRLEALDSQSLMAILRLATVTAGLNCAERGCRPPLRGAVEAVLAGAIG